MTRMRFDPVASPQATSALFLGALAIVVALLVWQREPATANPLRDFRLQPVASSLVRVTSAPEVPDETLGVYFINVQSGEIDGWYDPRGELHVHAFSGDNRLVAFRRNQPGAVLLADRETGAVYAWQGGAEIVLSGIAFNNGRLAASGGRVMFRIENPAGDDWFAVVDLDMGSEVVATFEAPAYWGVLAPDGERAAVFWDAVYIADLRTGRMRPAGGGAQRVELPDHLFEQGHVWMKTTLNGYGLLVYASSPDTRPERRYEGTWLHYRWDGELLAEGKGLAFYPSPDGSAIAVLQPLLPELDAGALAAIAVYDTGDGSFSFRVIGVRPGLAGLSEVNRWLADNSGFVVSHPELGLALATRDGGFLPAAGLPSPAAASVFSSGALPVDAGGEPLHQVTFPASTRDFVPPWGETGDEVRVLTPHLGHDCCQAPISIVRPYIDSTPRGGPPVLELEDRSGVTELRDAPAGEVVALLRGRQRVIAHEARFVCSDKPGSASDCGPEAHDVQVAFLIRQSPTGEPFEPWAPVLGTWIRVTTGDGAEGWVLIQALIQGV